MAMTPVDRIVPPSVEEFEARYISRSRPVILRGAISDWPAITLWSRDYFMARFGDRQVPTLRAMNGAVYDLEAGARYESIRLSEYVALLNADKPIDLYMTFRVQETMPELFDDIVRPAYCADAEWTSSKLWFAGPNAKSPLHRDLPENLYAQIVGHKTFILIDRRLTSRVHRHSFLSRVPNCSPVDAEAPDLARYPRFRDTPMLKAEVGPGDLLYIPSLWWHQARSLDMSVAINLFWLRGVMTVVARAAELFMRVRGFKL
jgi:hypothetical protein